MNKPLLLSSMLIIGLTTTSCVEKETHPIIETRSTANRITIENVEPTSITATNNGKKHQLLTVQGLIIHVQERSNGFLFPQYEGKTILLQLFGKKCEYCFEEMPLIHNMQSKYTNHLNIIALQAQNPMSTATTQRLIQQFQMNYPIIDKEEARPLLYVIKSTYGWNGVLPYTLLIKNGVTEYSFSGKVNPQELEEAVKSLL